MTSAFDHPDWLASSLLADVGAYALSARIKPLDPAWRLWGPALPVSVPPGDNLAIHHALTLCRAGEVLVIDAQAYLERAVMGGIMTTQSKAAGLAGVVIDGAIRDVAGLAKLDIGIWARGATPAGPYKDGPGEIGYPLACGGLAVMPGDLIAADEDGVVVIPRADAAAAVAAAEGHAKKEEATFAAIASGKMDRAWIAETLTAKGVARA